MRLLLIPVVVAAVLGAGWTICTLAGWNPHVKEMWTAALISVFATLAGLIPLWVARRASQAAAAQAGLVATAGQMFCAIAMFAIAMWTKLVTNVVALTFWLLPLYWVTLTVLVVLAVRLVRQSPPASAASSLANTPDNLKSTVQ